MDNITYNNILFRNFQMDFTISIIILDFKYKWKKFHIKNKNYVTLTAVRPPARFGAIKIRGSRVNYFKENCFIPT